MAAAFTVRRTAVACLLAGGLTASGIAAAVTPAGATGRATSVAATPAPVSLPALPGPYQVGTFATELVDRSRLDPFAPTKQYRAVMMQLWYPSEGAARYPLASYMPAKAAAYEDQQDGLPPGTLESVRTHGHLGAPAARSEHGWPVVLFSPGAGTSRCLYTALVEDIASRGYVVVAIDHPYDADVVEFPDGHLALGRLTDSDNSRAVQVRAQDASFLISHLTQVARASGIARMSQALDTRRIAMFGHSLGGAAAAAAMLDDRRIAAGADLDGTFYGSVVRQGLDRSFLLMSSALHDRGNDTSWTALWARLRGWRLDLKLAESGHLSYSDIAVLAQPLHLVSHFPSSERALLFGTINGVRAATVEQAYLTAFLSSTLRHRQEPLLEHPNRHYPEIIFER